MGSVKFGGFSESKPVALPPGNTVTVVPIGILFNHESLFHVKRHFNRQLAKDKRQRDKKEMRREWGVSRETRFGRDWAVQIAFFRANSRARYEVDFFVERLVCYFIDWVYPQ